MNEKIHPEDPDTLPQTSSENAESAPRKTDEPGTYVTGQEPKPPRKISLAAAVGAMITAVILAVLVTFSLTTLYLRDQPDAVVSQNDKQAFPELEVLDKLFRSLTVRDLDDDAIGTALLKAYVSATGDRYAEYYTDEEYAAQVAQQNGEMCGIGITVVNGTVTVDGISHQGLIVSSVYPDSPALEAGVKPNDVIISIGTGEDAVSVDELGYDGALSRLRGEEGTEAVFTVRRKVPTSDGNMSGDMSNDMSNDRYDAIEITAIRRKLTTQSVLYHVCETDSSIGIVRITGFDNTTAAQFEAAMDGLLQAGCASFVIDLRNNGGGLLSSVEDVLAFFLEPEDVMLYTRNKAGEKEELRVTVSEEGKVTSGSGKYTAEDVGKYRGHDLCVLVNGYTASAAELFTANIRDHGLGKVIGTQTYGKGTMQTTYSLSRYGLTGALKLTTRYYDPPSGENYDGAGITPDLVIELSEEAMSYNINLLPDDKDNQLQAAIGRYLGNR